MSHEVESMFFMGDTPWHGLGQRVVDAPTSQQAIALAGLDWTVGLSPLALPDGRTVGHRATVRSSDGAILGVVGPDYTPLQNVEAFGWFDPMVASGECEYHTAGSLRNGARTWILARIRRDPLEIVRGDAVEAFLLLSNGHDGTLAARVGFTPIRVVCANTLSMAHNNGASKLLKVKHTSGIVATLDAIRETVNLAVGEFNATAEQYRALANREIDRVTLEAYIRIVFRRPGAQVPTGLAVAGETHEDDSDGKRLVPRIVNLFETGRGAQLPGVRGTLWGAYNAVTEYTSYERGREQSTRLDSLWYGQGAQIGRRALEVGLQFAA